MPDMTTDWQKDHTGEYQQDQIGVRRYRAQHVDQLVPLGQYLDSKVAGKYEGVTLEDFETAFADSLPTAKKYAAGYVRRFEEVRTDGKGYYLYSRQPGSGKTMLACCILCGLADHYRVTTQAISTIEFLKRLKATWDDEDTSEEAVINPMLAAEVLLLDDCGSEKHSEWVDEQIYHIVDSRLNMGRPTFFTSNYSIDQLPYGERIKSRINAMTAQIHMPEMDVRAKVTRQREKDFLNQLSR